MFQGLAGSSKDLRLDPVLQHTWEWKTWKEDNDSRRRKATLIAFLEEKKLQEEPGRDGEEFLMVYTFGKSYTQ